MFYDQRATAAALEGMPVGFLALDRQSRVLYLNRRARALFRHRGRQENVDVGESLWAQLPDLEDSWFRRFTLWAHEAGIPIQVEEFWKPLDGRVELHIHPWSDGLGVFFQEVREGGGAWAVLPPEQSPEPETPDEEAHPGAERTPTPADGDEKPQGGERLRAEALDVLRPVAHELRTPLHAIVLSAERILKSRGLEDGAKAGSHVRNILRAAEHATRLTHDLHDLARLESGTVALQKEPNSTGSLVEEAVELHRPLAEEKGVRLETDVSDGSIQALVDSTRILQVFANLLENAIRHTEPGGLVALRAQRAIDGGRGIRFEVEDSGSGIPPERAPHLFGALAAQGPWGGDGTGLGLTIARAIVEAHGGALWVERSGEDGTTLAFTLPGG